MNTHEFTIAAAQSSSVKGEIAQNVRRHAEFVVRAAGHHANVVVFPELSLTGYEATVAAELAIDSRDAHLAPYNRYFPSLAANEKRRYPDIEEISARAGDVGFGVVATEVASSPPRRISEAFLRNVAEKNWSMFRLLSEDEFAHGLHALQQDRGCSFESSIAGETLVWFRKIAQVTLGKDDFVDAAFTAPNGVHG